MPKGIFAQALIVATICGMAELLNVLLVQPRGESAEKIRAQFREHAQYPIQLECAQGLADALAHLAEKTFAAILLDLDLPDAEELDSFIMLQMRAPTVPILVMAKTYDSVRAHAVLRAGAQDFLTWVQVENELERPLTFAIERHALRRAAHSHATQLQFSEARFRALINENADAIMAVNVDGVVRFANPAAAALFGRARDALIGSTFHTSLQQDRQTIQITRSGAPLLAQVRVSEMLWSGEPVFLVTLRDVTEQQRISDAFKAGEERYRELIAASSKGIWRAEFRKPVSIRAPRADQVHAILYDSYLAEWNLAMAEQYGIEDPAQFLGTTTAKFLGPDDPIHLDLLNTFVENEYRIVDAESHQTDRFGAPRLFSNTLYGIVRDEALVSLWGIRSEITQERTVHAERQVQSEAQHQRELAQALADCAVALNSTLQFEQVLDRILENVGRVVPHDAASIFLLEGDVARLARGAGWKNRQLQDQVEQLRIPVHVIPSYRKMMELGEPVLIPDTRGDDAWADLVGDWIQSYVGVPLRAQDTTIGFLNLDSATKNFFTRTHSADLQAFAAHAATALDNARRHSLQQKRANDFAELSALTSELALQNDLDALLNMLLERAMRLLHASCGTLALYDSEKRILAPRVSRGTPPEFKWESVRLGEGLVGRVAQYQTPQIVSDYRTWKARSPQFAGSDISAVIGVPMLFGGELIGVLALFEWGDTTRQFTQDDAQWLMVLATQAAALVHNTRLHEETEKRVQQLGLLYDAGLALNGVLEPQTQLDFLTRIAMRSVHADFAVFFRSDNAARELVFDFGLGFDAEKPYRYFARVPFDAPQGVEAWVARERLPVLLNDTHTDPRFFVGEEDMQAGIWVPIEHDKRLLGVLTVGARRTSAFTRHDERLLLLYASQAAVAMENARLYQNALQANERRSILHWASQEIISAGLDAERVYVAIHQAASRLMPCEAFAIAVLDEGGERIELPYLFDRGGRQPSGSILKDQGLSGYMMTTGTSLLIDDLMSANLPVINFGYPEQVTSILAVPLRHGGQVFGMLSAQAYRRGAYDGDDRVTLEMLAAHAAAALMNVRGAERMVQSLERAHLETALALAKTIETRAVDTGARGEHVAELAEAVARKMGLGDQELYALRLGALLRDIGKIGLPDEILLKPGALTETEWELMRRHPEIGAEILTLVGPLQNVIPLVRHHHERFDGLGYPDGLSGEKIPLGARIISVVDAFSAMTNERAYRKPRAMQDVLDELNANAGTQFDPNVVEAFLHVWEKTDTKK